MPKWQQPIFDRIVSGGFKPGELVVTMSGRGVGKSMMTQQAIDRLMRDLLNRPIEDLILSEGKVYGARFHCVEPIGGNWSEMEAWASKTFGPPTDVWDFKIDKVGRWYCNDRRFWFRNEADRTMFVLKWR